MFRRAIPARDNFFLFRRWVYSLWRKYEKKNKCKHHFSNIFTTERDKEQTMRTHSIFFMGYVKKSEATSETALLRKKNSFALHQARNLKLRKLHITPLVNWPLIYTKMSLVLLWWIALVLHHKLWCVNDKFITHYTVVNLSSFTP